MVKFTLNSALGTKFLGHIKKKAGTLAMAAAVAFALSPSSAFAFDEIEGGTTRWCYVNEKGNTVTDFDESTYSNGIYKITAEDVAKGALVLEDKTIYLVNSSLTLKGNVTVGNNVLLVICDGVTLNLGGKSLNIGEGKSIDITTGNMGGTSSKGTGKISNGYIAGYNKTLGTVNIWNGNITVERIGLLKSATASGEINITGGNVTVTAEGKNYGVFAKTVNIKDAKDGGIKMTVNTKQSGIKATDMNIELTKSKLDVTTTEGSGALSATNSITIDGDSVFATAQYTNGHAISCGYMDSDNGKTISGTIDIKEGSYVRAISEKGHAIAAGVAINIAADSLYAESKASGSAIVTLSGKVNITSGKVKAVAGETSETGESNIAPVGIYAAQLDITTSDTVTAIGYFGIKADSIAVTGDKAVVYAEATNGGNTSGSGAIQKPKKSSPIKGDKLSPIIRFWNAAPKSLTETAKDSMMAGKTLDLSKATSIVKNNWVVAKDFQAALISFEDMSDSTIYITYMVQDSINGEKGWRKYAVDTLVKNNGAKTVAPADTLTNGTHIIVNDKDSTVWYLDSLKLTTAYNFATAFTKSDTLYAKTTVVDSALVYFYTTTAATKDAKGTMKLDSAMVAVSATGTAQKFIDAIYGVKHTDNANGELYGTKRQSADVYKKIKSSSDFSSKIANGTFIMPLKDAADTAKIETLGTDTLAFPVKLYKDTNYPVALADSVIFYTDDKLSEKVDSFVVLYGDTLTKDMIPADPTRDGYVFMGWIDSIAGNTASSELALKNQSGITATKRIYAKWGVSILAVIGEDTTVVTKPVAYSFKNKKLADKSLQVDLYNAETVPTNVTLANKDGKLPATVSTNAQSVNIWPQLECYDWYTDADFQRAITSWPYSVKALTDASYIIYGKKLVKVTEVYTYGKTILTDSDFVASGVTVDPDTFNLTETLNEMSIRVNAYVNADNDTITDFKFTKDTTIYALCDTMLLLNFYSNDDVNTLYQIYVSYNDTLVDYLLTDTVKYVGDSTYTFHGWYVPMKDEKFYYVDEETNKNVQYEWDEEIVKDKYNMMPWYTLVKWYNMVISDMKCAQLADHDFGYNHVINIYGYWPNDPTGGDPTVDPTGINEVNGANENVKTNGRTYNLAGQEVDSNYNGVVIKNGQKFVQK